MKRIACILIPFLLLWNLQSVSAQAQEGAQLLLNVTKLKQFKQILSDLEKGYTTLRSGYSQIEHIASGNFDLHAAFLDRLLQVNPTVKSYYKVAEIIRYQLRLVKDYKSAISRFKSSDQFTIHEISYLSTVYGSLFKSSLKQLDELTLVLTNGTLRMTDEQRLVAIDQIHADMQERLLFHTAFNEQTTVLAIHRSRASQEVNVTQSLYGITK